MFTLSKTNPRLSFNSEAYLDLGSKLQDFGNRILLICSLNPKDKNSIILLKNQFKKNNLTFIQSDIPKGFINIDIINKIEERAKTFNVTSIVAIGSAGQRMCGRAVAENLSLHYLEIPTNLYAPYLLIPHSIYSNRVANNFIKSYISPERISDIYIEKDLLRETYNIENILISLSILLDLAWLFTSSNNNIIAKEESRNLFIRILEDIEEDRLDREKICRYGVTANIFHGSSTEVDLPISIYSWIIGQRFDCKTPLISATLLPAFLDSREEVDYSLRIREIFDKHTIPTRLVNLGYSLEQFQEIMSDNLDLMTIVADSF